jgi:hypothetical protein
VAIKIGMRFGRLIVTAPELPRGGRTMFRCVCDCGAERVVRSVHLRSGHTASCGCGREKHGHTSNGKTSRAYLAWTNMRQRCENERSPEYPNYGARGVVVCERWRASFQNFLSDVGEPSEGLSLDRIDNSRGYEPGNVRWATAAKQSQNRRVVRITCDLVNEIRGRSEHGEGPVSIARRMGISYPTVSGVIHRRTWRDVP